ncbi:MAG TPA: peptidylprolyl isomerase [Rhodothermales bacterium]
MSYPRFGRRGKLSLPLTPAFLSLVIVFSLVVAAGCKSKAEEESSVDEDQQVQIQMGEPISDSTLAAIVTSQYGADTLTTEEFRTQVGQVMMQFPQLQTEPEQAREMRRTLVEQFALTHALEGEVEENGISVDSTQLEQQIAAIRSRFQTEEEFQQALAEQDLTEERFRESMHEQMKQQSWQEREIENAVEPTEQEIEAYRDEQAEQVRVQHILFFSPSVDSTLLARAEAVLDSAKSGDVPFEDLARRHSDDGTAAQGGDLDYFSRGEMVEPFSDAAFALEDSGDVADSVVRTQFGYHIIRLTGRRTGDRMAAEQAKEMMMRRRQQDAIMAALDRLRGKVTVRVNPQIVDADLNAPLQ